MKSWRILPAVIVISLLSAILPGAYGQATPGFQSLDLATRVHYQQAIEEVYWRHRIWPEQNASPKPPVTAIISPEKMQAKAEEGLRLSSALAMLWHAPISGPQLQAEIARMVRDSRQPELLGELFEALDNSPGAIAEMIARASLAERLAKSFYENDPRFQAKSQPFENWWSQAKRNYPPRAPEADYAYVLPEFTHAAAAAESWSPTHDLPDGDNLMTAVWTGSEMIIWGGGARFETGARYNPATDTWHSTNNSTAPMGKTQHTAVWTGTEMIVWGGCGRGLSEHSCQTADGGRYNPATDSWTPTSLTGRPNSRISHSAVWTGTEMIVWGGCSFINDACRPSAVGAGGGRYNPTTDSWTLTNTANAPEARDIHTAVWTGTQMIVWGGVNDSVALESGGVYTPATDTWTATPPFQTGNARYSHTAIWSGTEMIVWGGTNGTKTFGNGGRYNPAKNAWRGVPALNAPGARSLHAAVWSGTEMIVWGGVRGLTTLNTGGRYNPTAGTWKATSTVSAPAGRSGHPAAVWSGSQMIVWGGFVKTGGRYDPVSDNWTPTNAVLPPTARTWHTGVWTGTEMVVWGGDDGGAGTVNTGGRYNLALDTWTATSVTGAPGARHIHTAVWTGTEMIIWGGAYGSLPYNTGGRYNPTTDSWVKTSTAGAPAGRDDHSAVWSGTEMIVFGGSGNQLWMNSGGRYNPSTDTWRATTKTGAPSGRDLAAAVWSGSEMIIWGGGGATFDTNTGARYNPVTDSWTAMTTTNAPAARNVTAFLWTGSRMLVWGGQTYSGVYTYHNDGGLYDPATNTWTSTNLTGAPSPRGFFGYVWTGTEMIVWGGCGTQGGFCSGSMYTGGRYNPSTDSWIPTATASAPSARNTFPAVWTGSKMIVWSGMDNGSYLASTGGVYTPGP